MAEESGDDRQDPPEGEETLEPAVRRIDSEPDENADTAPDESGDTAPTDEGASDAAETTAPADEPVVAGDYGYESWYGEDDDGPLTDDSEADAAESDGGFTEEDIDGMYGGYEYGGSVADEQDDPTVVDDHEGAPDDEEMPLADHIEEMVKRLGVVIVVMAAISGVVFPFGTQLINFLWFHYLPGTIAQCPGDAATIQTISEGGAACARVYHPLAVVLARLKVATLAGFVAALPVFVYETYLFMRPGLYPHERRYYIASVPTSLVLASVGMLFAHFLVIPLLFDYFVYYSQNATVIAFGLAETFDLIVLLLGAFALVFQIPLFIMLALMMGLVTRDWLETRRLIFWGVFAGLAFLFTADPTGMGPIIVAATMIVLFEGTLLLARWTGKE
ncbi:twin-arginine translocase subunit TatC [Halosegnis sp.]|uniref:twin-arginine translocase subunit TatC n=1 Tax=Halosegnis sp. TaxID=2864959 RepID=UPI0035D4BAEC